MRRACLLGAILAASGLADASTPTAHRAAAAQPGGSLVKRIDAVYPVSNYSTQCYAYEVFDNKGRTNDLFRPYDTYPTVQGIVAGMQSFNTDGNYYENANPSTDTIADYLNLKYSLCPATKFVLIGFSASTVAITQVLNMANIHTSAIAAIILYGDGLWVPGRIENRGTAVTTGSTRRGFKSSSGITIPVALEPITRNFCLLGDWECQTFNQTYGISPTDPHHQYVNSTWQDQAVDFAVTQLKLAIAPSASQAVAGRRRLLKEQQVIGESTVCQNGFSFCPSRMAPDDWECIPTHSTLEYCGGCPGGNGQSGYGVDCTGIESAAEVACIQGTCRVSACEDDFTISEDGLRCVATA